MVKGTNNHGFGVGVLLLDEELPLVQLQPSLVPSNTQALDGDLGHSSTALDQHNIQVALEKQLTSG